MLRQALRQAGANVAIDWTYRTRTGLGEFPCHVFLTEHTASAKRLGDNLPPLCLTNRDVACGMGDLILIRNTAGRGSGLPALGARAVKGARTRFLEFFTVNIRNPNT